jgi:hypothetical protein
VRVVRRLLGWTGRAVVVCAVSSAVWVPAQASFASSSPEPTGNLGFSPASGDDWTPLAVLSTGTCSDLRGSNLQLTVSGHGMPEPTNVTPNLKASIYPVDPSTGGYDVPLQDSLHNFAAQQSPPAVLSGRYDFTLVCKRPWGRSTFGTYHGALFFSSPTRYRALTTVPTVKAAPVSPGPEVGHTTATPRPTRSSSPAPVTPVAAAPRSPRFSHPPVATHVARSSQPERASSALPPALMHSPQVQDSASPSSTVAASSARQVAADPPRSRGGSPNGVLAAAVATLSVVVALGLVLRRRLGIRGPS